MPEVHFLDVSSLDGLIPLVVEACDNSGNVSNIGRDSVELFHLLQVRVA